jgi:hypothetical protein
MAEQCRCQQTAEEGEGQESGRGPQLGTVTEHQTTNATRTIVTRGLPGGLHGGRPTNVRLPQAVECPLAGLW